MGLSASEHSLNFIFSGHRRYRIPNFQRQYSWHENQALQLAEDLYSAWEREDSAYFLGSVVLVRHEDTQTYDVIDGQQRLTTLSLMLAVMRHLVGDLAQKEELGELLNVKANSLLDIEASPRILLRDADRSFMQTFVHDDNVLSLLELGENDVDTVAQRNILFNTRAFVEFFSEMMTDDQLWPFVKYTMSQVVLVTVETDDYESAHRIFGVMNTRGMPLTAADIFKSRVIGGLPPDVRDDFSRRWDAAIANAGNDPDELFQQLLVLATKTVTKRALVEEFPTMVLDRMYSGPRGATFIDEVLLPYSEVYRYVVGQADHPDTEIDRLLRKLQQYQGEEWRPVAMWAVRHLGDRDQLIAALRGLERVTGANVTAGLSSSLREGRMVAILRKLEESGFEPFVTESSTLFTVPDEVRKKAIQRLKSDLPRSQMRKIWLTRAHEQATGQFIEIRRNLHIHSVLPNDVRTRTRWGITPAQAERWHNRLGVLALTRDGAFRVSNHASLASAISTLVPTVSDSSSPANDLRSIGPIWMDEQFAERQDALIRLIAEHWGIRRDSEGFDLVALSEAQLLKAAATPGDRRTRRIRLGDVMEVGLVDAGDEFVWVRKTLGDSYTIVATENGRFRLPDGREVDTPTAAVRELTGSGNQALDVWVRESDGRSIREIWEIFRNRI